MVKKNNSRKKSDNKKVDYKKTNNTKTIVAVIVCAIISVSVLLISFTVDSTTLPETSTTLPETTLTMSDYVNNLSNTHQNSLFQNEGIFNFYVTDYDSYRFQNELPPLDGIRITLNKSNAGTVKIISILKPNDGTVVIYPIFTSAAYSEPGFYTYFRGDCDESCITDLSFENPEFKYTSSGLTAQILYHVGYDFLTDIEVDKNPELLQNYDTVILLHNEYLTQKAFDAISSHPNLIS